MIHALLFCCVSLFLTSTGFSQISIEEAATGVTRITTQAGRGTGFVVAADNQTGRVEVWTNGHVCPVLGERVSLRWFSGTALEQTTFGTVAESNTGNGIDMAKIISGPPNQRPYVFKIGGHWNRRSGNRFVVGFPQGGWVSAKPIAIVAENEMNGEFFPEAIPGESGSPVFDSLGYVEGVITFRTDSGTGIFTPIEHWKLPVISVSTTAKRLTPIPLAK
jgi:hypothetical protein